ncbi:hypothetical protein FDI40_gp445 [Agrobacterium phage Atu_ph07]|uniref:Uncharacterized protein n=1 Tax=Agrobacterium phage Atu_ph07 TaxID=2024264 RepID=A0A2L0V079_9CAUD|nr:hypothetical protein FDI40_gp445 [Agrobacterium phage Atu_ph07]AUZ95204.1 hypothetical protein [Agrobacterium phage Atu_ph07]
MIKPFNLEMFCNTYSIVSDELSELEIGVVKNFEKIIQEKYIDRVYSVSVPTFVFEDNPYYVVSRSVSKIDDVITGFMEILVATDKKIFCMNYVKILNTSNRIRFAIV